MAISNYTELQAAIATWVVRTDQTATIPDFITLYEADANRRIRVRQNLTTSQVTLSQGNALAVLPAGFLEDVELNYDDTDQVLTKAPFDTIDRMQTADSQPDRPALYAITTSGTQDIAIFETEADATYTLNLRYYTKWNIAVSNMNWLLTNAPDAYLFGSLAEYAMRVRDTELLTIAIQRRDSVTDWILRADSRTKSRTLMVDPFLRASTSANVWGIS
jgi:hypothetical protein